MHHDPGNVTAGWVGLAYWRGGSGPRSVSRVPCRAGGHRRRDRFLASDDARYVQGALVNVDGGRTAVWPGGPEGQEIR